MKNNRIILLMPFLLIVGCSGGGNESTPGQSKNGKILESQTHALEQAKEAENLIQSSFDKRRVEIEEQIK